jgi:hypothetical protein
MVLLKILSGKKAGSSWEAHRFPLCIGRSAGSDLRLEDAGIWEEHLKIGIDPAEGFLVQTEANTLASINGQAIQRAVLRNGDTIEIGSVKLQFWLSEARQRGQALREAFVWTVISLICFAQIALVYWLLTSE